MKNNEGEEINVRFDEPTTKTDSEEDKSERVERKRRVPRNHWSE